MSDLISRSELFNKLATVQTLGEAYGIIQGMPTVDAVPVRHGRWKPFDLTYGRNLYACSVCGDVSDCATVMGDVVYQFCPYCGAKMDGTQ